MSRWQQLEEMNREISADPQKWLANRHAQYREIISKNKRVLENILGEPGSYAFSYTIGNREQGLPELLLIGTNTGTYLRELSDLMIERGPFLDGEILNGVDVDPTMTNAKYRVKIIDTSRKRRPTPIRSANTTATRTTAFSR
jgi:hypothetical protein